uniref:Uncharacterized protein n=1 Tax=Lactarius sp. (in: basidiomycete fungi) TaxID=1886493 RepID=A0A2S0U414_9AGAM|nr:hypothetical protein [Lactarius sp. (in: basidiomycete fungi)]
MFYIITIIMIILNIIYHISGLFSVLAIIVWTINLFVSTMNLIQDGENFWYRMVQFLSISVIIYIISLNIYLYYYDIYKLAFIIPLSINKISYLDDIMDDYQNNIFFLGNVNTDIFNAADSKEISDFLMKLDSNKTYVVTFDLILDWDAYELGEPSLVLSKPILVTKESHSQLISDFILERFYSACYLYALDTLDETVLRDHSELGILVRFKEINLFWK